MKKVVITTGGTGGHIYPAISVAEKLVDKGVEVQFLGSKYRMEKDLVPQHGFKFTGLAIKPVTNIASIFRLFGAIAQSYKILKKDRPDAVIGFGNYISVPVIVAAILLRIEFYLHEQNVEMGFANKYFYRMSAKTFLSYDVTLEDVPIKYYDKVIVTGNPIRSEFLNVNKETERETLKFEKDEKMVLIMGGSLGAKSINESVLKNWDELFNDKDLRVYWATGKKNFTEINEKITKIKKNDVIKPYFDNVAPIMAAADIIVARAGATTISELIELEKPSILIPYAYKKAGQIKNADLLKNAGGAEIFQDEIVEDAIERLFILANDDSKLKAMKGSIKKLKKPNSTERIVEELNIWRS